MLSRFGEIDKTACRVVYKGTIGNKFAVRLHNSSKEEINEQNQHCSVNA